jgi:WD40 repeat protein
VGDHTFISYSRADRSYVDRLAGHLTAQGIPVWYDYEIETGDHFAAVIQEKLDTCAAVVVVLTPDSMASPWVNREISYAIAEGRPVLPLVLKRSRAHILLADLHQEDVTGGGLPPDRFLSRLRDLLGVVPSRFIETFVGHQRAVTSVAWSPDGTALVSGGYDSLAHIWSPTDGRIQATLTEHRDTISGVAWAPGGHFLATASWDGSCLIWQPGTATPAHLLHRDEKLRCIAWAPGLYLIVSAGQTLVFYRRPEEMTVFRGDHAHDVLAIAWSPHDDDQYATGSADNDAIIWRLRWDPYSPATPRRTRKHVLAHPSAVSAVAWAPDGSHLATGCWDGYVRLWDPESGVLLTTLRGHGDVVGGVAWSPDGQRLATASSDRTVRIWDPDTGRELRQLTGHTAIVTSVAWSPDGRHLASGSNDCAVRLWSMA